MNNLQTSSFTQRFSKNSRQDPLFCIVVTQPIMSLVSAVASFVLLHLISADIGPGGETCGPNTAADTQCPLESDGGFSSYIDSDIECPDYADCCYCEEIECDDCDLFKIEGENGARAVPSIYIDGDQDDGVKIECLGKFTG